MFGLTFEKLVLVALVAGFVIGPQRLPTYAHRLGEIVRAFRDFVEVTRSRTEADMGVSLARSEWQSLRQYDPRQIVRDALADPARSDADPARSDADPAYEALLEQAAHVRPGQRYLVSGSAAHPRRVAIASLDPDDPRRRAAEKAATEVDETDPSHRLPAEPAPEAATTGERHPRPVA